VSGGDSRILVALGTGVDIGDVSTVILGLTDATWADIADGKAQDIDLTKIGIPAQLLVMRGKDHNDIKLQLARAAKKLEIPDGGLADLSVPTPKRN
jgi:hypothetical protein